MIFCLDKNLSAEVKHRIDYLFDVFGLYFVSPIDKGRFISFESFPKKTLDICFIVGHNTAVSTFLNSQTIKENTIVVISCDGGYKKSFCIPNKKIYLSYRNIQGLTLRRKGENYGFLFDPTDSELCLYNCTEKNIYERINRSFDRIDI